MGVLQSAIGGKSPLTLPQGELMSPLGVCVVVVMALLCPQEFSAPFPPPSLHIVHSRADVDGSEAWGGRGWYRLVWFIEAE